jgi:hypothetical protein
VPITITSANHVDVSSLVCSVGGATAAASAGLLDGADIPLVLPDIYSHDPRSGILSPSLLGEVLTICLLPFPDNIAAAFEKQIRCSAATGTQW